MLFLESLCKQPTMQQRLMSLWLMLAISFSVSGQSTYPYAAGEIFQEIQKLQQLGSALYIAAHPDDENTRLITYLAEGKKVETAYISLTRGDGGQNLIGTEIGKNLGIIRTQELLAARRTDGGQQFFTRANDFGYSKTPAETFTIWDREKVLADLVWVIRQFRPDVLITRFAPEKYNYPTHGHHTASAILAEEAFDLAGDPDAFPEQLQYVEPWQPKRLYWNTSSWFYRRTGREFKEEDYLKIEVGGYNPAIGQSYGEIAGQSRSQHKSQGFGAPETKGSIPEYFELVKGTPVKSDFFEDIDLSWSRVPGGKPVGELLQRAEVEFDMSHPAAVLPYLAEAYALLEDMAASHYVREKKADLRQVIAGISGLYMEVTAEKYTYSPGDSVWVTLELVNRMGVDMENPVVRWPLSGTWTKLEGELAKNQPVDWKGGFLLPPNFPFSQPYYLRQPMEGIGMYTVQNQQVIGQPELETPLTTSVQLSIAGQPIIFEVPVQYKWVDRVDGEQFRDLEVTPPATVAFDEPVLAFLNGEAKEVKLRVTAWQENVKVDVQLELPEGWQVQQPSAALSFESAGEEQTFVAQVTPPTGSSVGTVKAILTINGKDYGYSRTSITYDHIPIQTYFPPAEAKVMNVDVETRGDKLGYIMGAGDAVPEHLEQIGYAVTMINENNISSLDLSAFDAILVGIRAFNTEEWLPAKKPILMSYVEEGGNLIVQYQTTWGLLTDDIGPYPLEIGRGRVTVEQAPITIIDLKEPLVNTPNRLTEADFEGWVQERGLYFAEEWSDDYRPVFRANDPGEDPLEGMLVVADYGKGAFMYTGISFFRELPGGVPGAFRLLANLISYGHE